MMSVGPPGGKGMMTRTGLLGYCWAARLSGSAAIVAAANIKRKTRFMRDAPRENPMLRRSGAPVLPRPLVSGFEKACEARPVHVGRALQALAHPGAQLFQQRRVVRQSDRNRQVIVFARRNEAREARIR